MSDSENHVALAAESPEAGRSSTAVLSQFLPLTIKGVSMNDGSISFGPRDIKIVLGYITNAISFGDFVNSAMKGRKFGAPDTALTQLACAQQIVRAANQYDNMLGALELVSAFSIDPDDARSDHYLEVLEVVRAAIARAKGDA